MSEFDGEFDDGSWEDALESESTELVDVEVTVKLTDITKFAPGVDEFAEWVAERSGHPLVCAPQVRVVRFDANDHTLVFALTGYNIN